MSTAMKPIRSYATRVEADLDRIALEAEGIACVVVGVGTAWEGGIEGVRLLVPDSDAPRAERILDER